MNFSTIKKDSPESYDLCPSNSVPNVYDFLDEKQVYLTITFEPEHLKQWGWEVNCRSRYIREQANYICRADAEQAGMETAFAELNTLILAGNA